MIRTTHLAIALILGGTNSASAMTDLDQINCFVAILAGRPSETLLPDIDLFLDGVIAGALATTQSDPGWFGRYTDVCLADPNKSVKSAIDAANLPPK